jgi:hypothetical protein
MEEINWPGTKFGRLDDRISSTPAKVWHRRRQHTARVPSVARGTIFNGTLSEMKYSNYDLMKI